MTSTTPRRCARVTAAAAAMVALCHALSGSAFAQAAATAPPVTRHAPAPTGDTLLTTIRALTAPGMDGRATGTPGSARARAWILERFTTIGLQPMGARGFEAPFAFAAKSGETVRGVNLVAACRGTRADGPVIVVSAHYDHLGVRNDQTYHGADDNASGIAVLLAVGEWCAAAPRAHTLVIVAFDAEEHGLQGARAFVASPPVPADRIALNVNFDMVSRSDRREIYAAGPGRWPRLRPVLEAAVREAPITVKFGHDTGGGQDDWTQQSDHGVFHGANIPFVYFGVEDHADYHKPTDTADKIPPDFLQGVAAAVISSLTALDRAPAFK